MKTRQLVCTLPRRCAVVSTLLVLFLTGGSQLARADLVSSFVAHLAADLVAHSMFSDAETATKAITINETKFTFDLSIVGGKLEGDGSFAEPFALDYWRGNLVFSPSDSDYWFGSDSLGIAGQIYHQVAEDQPHPGDALKGDIYTFTSFVDASGGWSNKKIIDPFHQCVSHPNKDGKKQHHWDCYNGQLTAQVKSYLTGNEIVNWTFVLQGGHLEDAPEPSSLLLLGSGALGLSGFLRKRLHTQC
jgi:hypothetical protein